MAAMIYFGKIHRAGIQPATALLLSWYLPIHNYHADVYMLKKAESYGEIRANIWQN